MKLLLSLPTSLAVFFLTCLLVLAQTATPTPEPGLHLKEEITVGDVLTVLTIVISLIGALLGLLISSYKDRQLKRKEYADRIRQAAGTIIAKLERWRELSLRYFGDIQPTITDTDIRIVKRKDFADARDFLWRNLLALRAQSTLRIVEEEIEIAYSDLYGYDPRIHALYVKAVTQLKDIDEEIHVRVMMETQNDVTNIADQLPNIDSAELGNALRQTCAKLADELGERLDKVTSWFRSEMIKLIEAEDNDIVKKQVAVSDSDDHEANA